LGGVILPLSGLENNVFFDLALKSRKNRKGSVSETKHRLN